MSLKQRQLPGNLATTGYSSNNFILEVLMSPPKKKILGLAALAVSALLTAVSFAGAADRLRVAKGGYSPSTPPYFTYAAPFLQKYDILVEDVLMSSGSLAGQALSSGDVKVLLTTGAIAMQADMAGSDLVIIAGAVHKLPYQIVARPEINRKSTRLNSSHSS